MAQGKKTGGRQKGSLNKATASRETEIAASGLTPLNYMLKMLRDENQSAEDRKWAAQNAAPYVHPKLSAIAAKLDDDLDLRSWMIAAAEESE